MLSACAYLRARTYTVSVSRVNFPAADTTRCRPGIRQTRERAMTEPAHDITPTPEGRLITELLDTPPRLSRAAASAEAKSAGLRHGMSETRWKQISTGIRIFRGQSYPEPPGPAATVAAMVYFAGRRLYPAAELARQLAAVDRADAAAELVALETSLSRRQADRLGSRFRRDTDSELQSKSL